MASPLSGAAARGVTAGAAGSSQVSARAVVVACPSQAPGGPHGTPLAHRQARSEGAEVARASEKERLEASIQSLNELLMDEIAARDAALQSISECASTLLKSGAPGKDDRKASAPVSLKPAPGFARLEVLVSIYRTSQDNIETLAARRACDLQALTRLM